MNWINEYTKRTNGSMPNRLLGQQEMILIVLHLVVAMCPSSTCFPFVGVRLVSCHPAVPTAVVVIVFRCPVLLTFHSIFLPLCLSYISLHSIVPF